MKVVILQPSYIPWRGYFHQIAKADLFVFYDDVQYDKRGWRNRNRIKTAQGPLWLTIPVYSKGAQTQHLPIDGIRICWDEAWNLDHWRAIELAYHKAPFFSQYAPILEPYYLGHPALLADFTISLTEELAKALGIGGTRFLRSSQVSGITGRKTDRLVEILKAVDGTHYISGPSARNYIEESKFRDAGIHLEFMVYDYPEYPQLYPPYEPQVSILDLLFMTGPRAMTYITGGRASSSSEA
jgi:hypothetical protein